jgi:hypothetical protein
MIDCRNCQHGNVTGAVFCVECGEQLGDDDLISMIITYEHITEELKLKRKAPRYSWLSLHLGAAARYCRLFPVTNSSRGASRTTI